MSATDDLATKPHFGTTKSGHHVHLRTGDHLAAETAYQRFNKRVALGLTARVGTMTCFWIFNLLSFILLAPTLAYDGIFQVPTHGFFHWYLSYGFIVLWTFLLSTYFQLVLLPALLVGQNLQNEASDARSAKTFEDVEQLRGEVGVVRGWLAAVAEHLGAPAPAAAEKDPA